LSQQPIPGTCPACAGRGAGRSRVPYLALHPMGFSVPPRLRLERWAFTPPFHPYPRFFRNTGGLSFCGTFRRQASRPNRPRVSLQASAVLDRRYTKSYAASRPVEFGLSSPPNCFGEAVLRPSKIRTILVLERARDKSMPRVSKGENGQPNHPTGFILTPPLSINRRGPRQVLECASPLALWQWWRADRKRQRTGALQDATARSAGSWSQLTSNFGRCSLSMNRPTPGPSQPPSRRSGASARREGGEGNCSFGHDVRLPSSEGLGVGSWSRCAVVKPWRLPMFSPDPLQSATARLMSRV